MTPQERVLNEASDILVYIKDIYGNDHEFLIRLIMVLGLYVAFSKANSKSKDLDLELLKKLGLEITKTINNIINEV